MVGSLTSVDSVADALPQDGLTLVAVDGLAGSGKSTLAARLADLIVDRRVQVVGADDLYGPETRDWRRWSAGEGSERYFDHVRLESAVLRPLSLGQPGRFERYDWDARKVVGSTDVDPVGVVIVEGVYLLRPSLRPYWTVSVWVDTPRSVRERRLRDRGEVDQGWIEHWMEAENHYQRVNHPDLAASHVIQGI